MQVLTLTLYSPVSIQKVSSVFRVYSFTLVVHWGNVYAALKY